MNVSKQYQLFLDLDGVLVDFDGGVQELTGRLPGDMEPRQMWPRLARTADFYDNLDWMSDGKSLWEFSLRHNPVILTGLPLGKWAEPQKRAWCRRELGEQVEVITCMTREKADRAAARSGEHTPVLVDDREKLREAWEAMGGIFIHHRSAAESIARLEELGF